MCVQQSNGKEKRQSSGVRLADEQNTTTQQLAHNFYFLLFDFYVPQRIEETFFSLSC